MEKRRQRRVSGSGRRQNTRGNRSRTGGYRKKRRSKAVLVLVCTLVLLALVGAAMLLLKVGEEKAYPLKYEALIVVYARQYDLDPNVVAGVIHTESCFDPQAKSSAGARGLMQIMPSTGKWIAKKLGVENYDASELYDPEVNIRFGCWYLRYLYDRYGSHDDVVFAAYNTGPNRISEWLKNPEYSDGEGNLTDIPIDVTRDYVDKVNRARQKYKEYYDLGT